MAQKTIIITGGGSGGHLIPMISLADGLKKKYEVVILTGSGPNDKLIITKTDYKRYYVISGKIHRYHGLWPYARNISNIIKTLFGFLQCLFILISIRPKLIFSKGGYVSLPVILAGRLLKIPIVVHESDLVIGMTNRIALKYANKFCVSFPPENYNVPVDKLVYTGHILRPEVLEYEKRKPSEIKRLLQINSDIPTLLITGGSQGALGLNKVVARSIDQLLKICNVIHLCGFSDFMWLSDIRDNLKDARGKYLVENYSHDIIGYMRIADLILSRAGSNSLAEIAALKKPAIIVPYQYAAGDHQKHNAEYFRRSGGGVVIDQDLLTSDRLTETVEKLLTDKKYLDQLGQNAYNANQFKGVEIISNLIDQLIQS